MALTAWHYAVWFMKDGVIRKGGRGERDLGKGTLGRQYELGEC